MVKANQVVRSHEAQSKLNQKTNKQQTLTTPRRNPLASNIMYFIT